MIEKVILQPGKVVLNVEVLTYKTEVQQGIRGAESLEGKDGILFEYPIPTNAYFWMKNTSIPLTIAWFRIDGTIVDWMDLEPGDETPYAPIGRYSLALEVRQGSVNFSERSILRINRTKRTVGRPRLVGNTDNDVLEGETED